MGKKIGLDCKLYYNAAGNEDPIVPGNWTELTNCRDVTLNLEKGEADVTTRGNAGWRATAGTIKDGSIEFEMVWDTADAGFTAIKDAYFNNTPIALAILDEAGGEGLDADFSITNFSRKEALEQAITVSVTAKPTYSTRAPAWVEPTP